MHSVSAASIKHHHPAAEPKPTEVAPKLRAPDVLRRWPSSPSSGVSDNVALFADHLTIGRDKIPLGETPTSRSAGALLKVARQLAAQSKNPFTRFSAAKRAQVTHTLLAQLRYAPASKGVKGVMARSAASALLVRLVLAMTSSGEKLRRDEVAQALFQAARSETDPHLKLVMLANLRQLPDRLLTQDDELERDALIAQLQPARLQWAGTTLRVAVCNMVDFLPEQIAYMRDHGYQVAPYGHGCATATKTLVNAEGREVEVVFDLCLGEDKFLEILQQKRPTIGGYSGHSQVGGVLKQALEKACGDLDLALLFVLACRSVKSLSPLIRHYPGKQFLLSEKGTYAHDDFIVLLNTVEGAARGETYAQAEAASIRDGIWEPKNYIFPQEAGMLANADLDGNGSFERDPKKILVYEPLPRWPETTSTEIAPLYDPPAAEGLSANRAVDAVAWFANIHATWAEECGGEADQQLADRIFPAGWFDPAPNDDAVIHVEAVTDPDGKPALMVRVSTLYAHLTPDALAMLLTFELCLAVTTRTRPDESRHTQRLRAMSMVGSYLYFCVGNRRRADTLIHRLAHRYGFPKTLSWAMLRDANESDAVNDCSPKVIRALERRLAQADAISPKKHSDS